MAIAFVAKANFVGAQNGGTSGTANMTGVNLLTMVVAHYSLATNTPSDSKGNTYVKRKTLGFGGAPFVLEYWDCLSPSVDSAMTFSYTGSSIFNSFCVAGFSGVDTTAGYCGGTISNSGGTGVTSYQAGSITTTGAGALVLSGLLGVDNMTATGWLCSGLTVTDINPHIANGEGSALAYLVQGSAGAINPTWSGFNTGSEPAGAFNVWYLPATGGGPTYTLALGQGAYALTGKNVVMLFNRKLTLAQGSYSLTGKAVGLLRGFKLSLGQGAYALTGRTLGLLYNRKLILGQGSYALTGKNINLLRGYLLSLGHGTYSLTGNAINMVWSGVAAATYTFALACGSYALSGQAVSLRYGRRLLMASGVYNLTGNPVSLLFNRKLSLGQGTYNLTGRTVGLLRGFRLALASGSYALAGQAIAFKRSYVLQLAKGVYSLTGQALNIVRQGAAVFGYTPRFAFKAEPRNRTFKPGARKRSNKD